MTTWRLTLPCTKAEGEGLDGEVPALAAWDPPPVLMTSEPDPAQPDAWRLDVLFDGEPPADLVAAVKALVPSAAAADAAPEPLADEDWVARSQAGLEPIATARFYIRTRAERAPAPAGLTEFRIEAGRAFGTGHHATTTGCLLALERLKAQGKSFRDILDLGTGTGLLAFAALELWPGARAIASDIDPVSIEVAAENARVNRVPLGRGSGRLALAVADGFESSRLVRRAPYDLIIANILAEPLIALAPAIAAALAPHGHLLLAGLLDRQAEAVIAAYRRHGVALRARADRGEWPTLTLRRQPRWG